MAGLRRLFDRCPPRLVAVFLLLWGASLVPLWWPRFLPCLDLPNSLATVAILHRYGDAAWNYQRHYALNLLPVPYWGYLLPVHLLAYLAPIEIANKIFLSMYALAFPVGAGWLAARMGRSPWLAVLAFPLVYNMNFSYGFVTFCIGMTVLSYALVALDGFLERPDRSRGAAVGLLTTALYFCHVLPWLYFGAAALVLFACHGWKPRRMASAAALMLPSVAIGLYAFAVARQASTALASGQLMYSASRERTLALLQRTPDSLITTWPADAPYQILLLLGVLWLALLITSDAPRTTQRDQSRLHAYRLELLASLAALLAFILPTHLYKPLDLWIIGSRFLSVAALFAALLPRGTIHGRRRFLLIPAVALAFIYPLLLGRQWKQFDLRAAHMRELLANVPRGSSTLTLIFGDCRDSFVADQSLPYLAFHAYPQLLVGGFDPWAVGTGFPMVLKKDAALPAPPLRHPEGFDPSAMTAGYDYVLSHREKEDFSIFGPTGEARLPMVGKAGDWRLYKVAHN